MNKNNKIIDCIIENIKNIEAQIETFKQMKPFFFQKHKLQKYYNRIKTLESIKENLYKLLEYNI